MKKDDKKKVTISKMKKIKKVEKIKSRNFNLMLLVTFFLGVLLIASAYAWFQASLDVKVKMVNLVVSKKNGLFISLDGIEFGSSVEISEESLINQLKNTYPGNTSQWARGGLYPISSKGIPHSNTSKLDFYASVAYEADPLTGKSYLSTRQVTEDGINPYKNYVAFDIFLKNITGSPVSDNLYIDEGTGVTIDNGDTEQIRGLVNSIRMAFVKVGTVSRNEPIEAIQNIECNDNCEMIIYEPNATNHTELSIERAKKFDINLLDGQYYPTLAITGPMDFYEINDVARGNLAENFELQITRVDIDRPIFEIPDGITKMRVYVWIEGQDIDSFETKSEGADVSIVINLIKDTAGYDAFNN